MALGIYEEEDIRAIAISIRDNSGLPIEYTTKDMPNGIKILAQNSHDEGEKEGYDKGKTDGVAEGIEQGKTEANAVFENANSDLENILYGEQRGYPVQNNMSQAKFDLYEIGEAIRESGVTPSKTTEGYAENIGEIYGAGRKSQYDEFWDTYQDYGKREAYDHAFAYYNDSMFNPKYDIVVKGCAYMFYRATISAEQFNKILQDRKIDFSRTTSVNMVFSAMNCEELPFDIDLSNATSAFEVFAWNGRLKKIKKIIMSENTPIEGWFTHDTRLENLTIEGTIGQNGFNVQWSTKLSKASWVSIINALSETTSGMSITGSLESVRKAFETYENELDGTASAEWLNLIATKSNWTVNLV